MIDFLLIFFAGIGLVSIPIVILQRRTIKTTLEESATYLNMHHASEKRLSNLRLEYGLVKDHRDSLLRPKQTRATKLKRPIETKPLRTKKNKTNEGLEIF